MCGPAIVKMAEKRIRHGIKPLQTLRQCQAHGKVIKAISAYKWCSKSFLIIAGVAIDG